MSSRRLRDLHAKIDDCVQDADFSRKTNNADQQTTARVGHVARAGLQHDDGVLNRDKDKDKDHNKVWSNG
jgi:hypothetical protein